MKQKFNCPLLLIIFAAIFVPPTDVAAETRYSYESAGKVYRYTVEASGDNYNFEFDAAPASDAEQLNAAVQVLQSIYRDASIDPANRQPYIRERARCSMFEAGLYDYTFCVFPNDLSPEKKDRFRGFVTQMPNWKWMVVWNLLPTLLVFGAIFFFTKKSKGAG